MIETAKPLTEKQKRFVELDKRKAEIKKFVEEYKAALDDVVRESGIGAMFQDEEKTVYKIVEPDGKFVYFDRFDICRTRREGETKGSLSMKEAESAGFKLK